MCGRFTQQRPVAELALLFNARPLNPHEIPFNVYPGQEAYAVIEGQTRVIAPLIWGYQGWEPNQLLFNARSETWRAKPTFQQSMPCLIPVTSFEEKGHQIDGGLNTTLALAGIWRPDRRFAILTENSPASLAHIHNRMPLIIPPQRWTEWLNAE